MLEKVLMAVMGALVGSLIGRLVMNPGWIAHVVFLVAGAILFLAADRWGHVRKTLGDHPEERT
jgi:hypothetical protein